MKPAVRSIPLQTPQDGRTGKTLAVCLPHDPLVKGHSQMSVIFADEDP
jgi:hypothetical protein